MRGSRWLPGIAIAATVVCRLPSFLHHLLDSDEATFASIAALMNAGGRLYADGGVDNKFPGIFWTYAGAFKVFGAFAMQAVHAAALLAALAAALLVGAIARRIAGARAGWLAVLFYGVHTTAFPKMLGAGPETFMMAPLCASVLLTLSPRPARLFGAGALIALACVWKQIAIVNLAVSCGAALLAREEPLGRRIAGVLATLVGFATVVGAMAALFAARGTLGELLHWTLLRLFSHYGPSAWHWNIVADGLLTRVLPFAVVTLGLWWCAGKVVRAQPIITLWLAVSIAGSLAGGHFFPHYFIQVVAPLAVLAAAGFERASRAAAAAAVGMAAVAGIGFFVVAALLEPVTEHFGAPEPDFPQVAAYVRDHTAPADRVFVWGMAPPIYATSGRLPATRFVAFLRGLGRDRAEDPALAWDAGPDVWPLFEGDIARHPPTLVVDTAPANYFDFKNYPMSRFPAIERLITAGYVRETTIGGVDIYRRASKN